MPAIKKVFEFIKANIKNHKKKYIAFSLLLAISYYIKKKLSMQNLLGVLMKVIKVLQYIPLPEAPQYREVPQLDITQPFDFMVLKDFMNTQNIAKQIQQLNTQNNSRQGKDYENKQTKSELWKQMLNRVMAGYGFTMCFFDLTQIFTMIKCKYINEFRYFGAQEQFLQYINILNNHFSNHLDYLFNFVKLHQQHKVALLDPALKYTSNEIILLLKQLSQHVLSLTEDVSEQKQITKKRELLDQDVERFFYTDLQKSQPKQRGVFIRTLSWLWNNFSIPTIQTHQFQATEQRFSCIKQLFRMGIFEINGARQLFKDNQKTEELFDLVNQQLFSLLRSLNFNNLWSASVKYNTQKFINRLQVFLKRKGNNSMLLGNYLSIISKICLQEFANSSSVETNRKYLDKQLKQALKLKMSQVLPEDETLRVKNILVGQLIQLKGLQIAKNELILKYFHERGGVDIEVAQSKNPNNDRQMREFLAYLTKNQDQRQNQQQSS